MKSNYRIRGAINPGIVLDLAIFITNLFVMRRLSAAFVGTLRSADRGSVIAQGVLFAIFVLLFILPPLGATLLRWHFHRRRKSDFEKQERSALAGCLFNPIFYFCLTAVIFSVINAFFLQTIAKNGDPGPAVFITSIFIGLALMITHTVLVYRFFIPPKKPPQSAFLLSPVSERLGHSFIFLNAFLYQIIWNTLTFSGIGPPSGVAEVIGRLFFIGFLALLIYFPPRMFYLVDSVTNRKTWITIILANLPMVLRLVFGLGNDVSVSR